MNATGLERSGYLQHCISCMANSRRRCPASDLACDVHCADQGHSLLAPATNPKARIWLSVSLAVLYPLVEDELKAHYGP